MIRSQLMRVRHHLLTRLSRAVFRPQPIPSLEKLGSAYGGWTVPVDLLSEDSVCYLAGVGEDITFDLALIERVGCEVYALDPTPRAALHVETHAAAVEKFHFLPVGLWSEETVLRFYAPADASHVSHSVTNLQGTTDYFEAACVPLSKLLKEHGHDHVDLLKMDIEGAEHTVIDWLLQSGVLPRILAVEFDQPTPWRKVRHSVNRLRDAGYELVAIDIWDYTFVRPLTGPGLPSRSLIFPLE